MREQVKSFYRKYNLIIMFIFVLVFLLVAILLQIDKVSTIDNYIYNYISLTISPTMTNIFKIITSLGSFYAIVSICLLSFLFFKDKRNSRLVTVNAMVIFTITIILKYLFARDRPIDINIITEYGYSFPSSHSAVSVAFYGFLAYLVHKNVSNKKLRYSILICLTILTLLIGISRIYLGVHYATDVLAGFAISAAYLIMFIQFVYKHKKRVYKHRKTKFH